MPVMVYKRTHNGDPDQSGSFGSSDCMGPVRNWSFEAVIGVGGIGRKAQAKAVAGKVNWIGIGPHKTFRPDLQRPVLVFEHFLDFGTEGPDFRLTAPRLADRMYSKNVRVLTKGFSEQEYSEVLEILSLAQDAPPSPALVGPEEEVKVTENVEPTALGGAHIKEGGCDRDTRQGRRARC